MQDVIAVPVPRLHRSRTGNGNTGAKFVRKTNSHTRQHALEYYPFSPSKNLFSSNDEFEWTAPVAMELLFIRMSRSFAKNRLLTVL